MKRGIDTPIAMVGVVIVALGVAIHILTYTLEFGWGGAIFAAFLLFIGGLVIFIGEEPKEEAKPLKKQYVLLICSILPLFSLGLYWTIITPFL